MKAYRTLNNLEELKGTERIKNVSSKYIPIKTTEFINSMKMDFSYGLTKGNHHIAFLEYNDNLKCVVENSFNGSRAFRMHFTDGDLNFGYTKQIHRGKEAHRVENLNQEFTKAIRESLTLLQNSKDFTLPKESKKIIFDTAFKARRLAKTAFLNLTPDELPDDCYEFMKDLFSVVITGDFTYTTSRGTRTAREIKNDFRAYDIEFKTWAKLKELHLELTI